MRFEDMTLRRRGFLASLGLGGLGLVGAGGAEGQAPVLDSGIPLIDGPWSNDADKFSFIILGDKTSGGEGKWPIYDRCIDAMNTLNPDFVISIGDMIPGHMTERAAWDAEWAEYMEHARRLKAPLFFTVGNHDIANVECYRFWQEDFGKTYYSFDYKGCHFLIFNTEEERIDGRGPVWQAMMDWTLADIAASKDARHTFVFFHKPMWDDPRFEDVWAQLEGALAGRRFTAVAGHEHYQSAVNRNGNWCIIQTATGAGVHLSEVTKWGGYQGFAHVTVDEDAVNYAVIQDLGGIWPVDVLPLSFRKAITHELVIADARPGADFSGETVTIDQTVTVHNVLDKAVVVRVAIDPVGEAGWQPRLDASTEWHIDHDVLRAEVALDPGQSRVLPVGFTMPTPVASKPPAVRWEVRYDGHWIEKESMRMVEVNTMPLHPIASYKAPKTVNLVGPFPLGPIDTKLLPADPAAANAKLMQLMGPENGGPLSRGLSWQKAAAQGVGLVNANALVGTIDQAACFVAVRIKSPVHQITHAIVAADNFSQTYLNGELISDGQDFGGNHGFVYPRLALKAGDNTLVVKLINNKADWFLRLLVADPQGNLTLSA